MHYDDVVALARAGFSAQQIAALAQTRAAAAAAPAAVAPAPAAAAPAPAAAAPAAAAPAADPIAQLMTQMGVLTQAVQASALMSAQQPTAQTADDILAEIIAPPRKEEK